MDPVVKPRGGANGEDRKTLAVAEWQGLPFGVEPMKWCVFLDSKNLPENLSKHVTLNLDHHQPCDSS